MRTVIVTGGCGFIGRNLIQYLIKETDWKIINIDCLTDSSGFSSAIQAADMCRPKQYEYYCVNVSDAYRMDLIWSKVEPDLVFHLAAESHVDKSITQCATFTQSNVVGTQVVLDMCLKYGTPRLIHCSTDEVYGSIPGVQKSHETSPIYPMNPYAATKAAADHLVRCYQHTHGLPAIIMRLSNNYGRWQFPEKLIPMTITHALRGEPVSVYGDGTNWRDWLHVSDSCRAFLLIATAIAPGDVYNVGGSTERRNIEVVTEILERLAAPLSLIKYVDGRPADDKRYSLNTHKITAELGWRPDISFEHGLQDTINWYTDNKSWWRNKVAKYNFFGDK